MSFFVRAGLNEEKLQASYDGLDISVELNAFENLYHDATKKPLNVVSKDCSENE
jgi:hypothetical protein